MTDDAAATTAPTPEELQTANRVMEMYAALVANDVDPLESQSNMIAVCTLGSLLLRVLGLDPVDQLAHVVRATLGMTDTEIADCKQLIFSIQRAERAHRG